MSHISVVTEGVEHIEQFEKLKELKCDLIQGYIVSRPLEVSAFNSIYQSR